MSCQKEIVKTITEKKADYVISLKGNQPRLLEDVRQYFDSFSEEIPVYTTMEKDHGRIEKRNYQLLNDLPMRYGAIGLLKTSYTGVWTLFLMKTAPEPEKIWLRSI